MPQLQTTGSTQTVRRPNRPTPCSEPVLPANTPALVSPGELQMAEELDELESMAFAILQARAQDCM